MANTRDLLSWASLTATVNEIKSPNQFLRRLIFSNTDPRPTETIEIGVLVGDRQVAPFVKRNAQAIEITPFQEKFYNVTAPHIRVKRHLDAAELLFERRVGHTIFVEGGDVMDAAEEHIARTSQRLNDVVTEAEEYLCSQALQGAISYEVDEEEAFQITFPRSASHTVDLGMGNYWDEAGGKPSADVLTAKQLVADDVGLGLTHGILGSEATTAFMQNAEISGSAALLDIRRLNAGDVTFQEQFNEDGAIFLGRYGGIDFWSYTRKTSVNGVSTDLIRAKYCEFVTVSPAAENVLYYGAIPDIRALEGRLFQGRRFSKSWQQEDPSVWWQLVASRPLPVPRRPDSMVSMKVVSGNRPMSEQRNVDLFVSNLGSIVGPDRILYKPGDLFPAEKCQPAVIEQYLDSGQLVGSETEVGDQISDRSDAADAPPVKGTKNEGGARTEREFGLKQEAGANEAAIAQQAKELGEAAAERAAEGEADAPVVGEDAELELDGDEPVDLADFEDEEMSEDEATLKARLRLTGVEAGSDAQAIIDEATLMVRANIYARLGDTRVTELLAITFDPVFTTNQGALRAIANNLEIKWVWLILLDRLPTIFMDNSGAVQEVYNEEAAFRSVDPERLDDLREQCLIAIEQMLDVLSGDQEIGDVGLGRIFTQDDQTPRLYPRRDGHLMANYADRIHEALANAAATFAFPKVAYTARAGGVGFVRTTSMSTASPASILVDMESSAFIDSPNNRRARGSATPKVRSDWTWIVDLAFNGPVSLEEFEEKPPMAINSTGKPDTRDYVLGRGIIYLAELGSNSLPGAYRDLGNAPSFAFTVETEDLEHQNSRSGLKVTDKRAVISQTISINFSIDELNHDNMSLFFTGAVDSFANPAVAGVSATVITTAVKKGFHYPLLTAYDGSGNQVVLADSTGLTVRRDPSGTPVTLVEGTDFEIDHATGQIFFLSTSVTVMEGDEIDWAVTAQAGAPATLERMQALKGS
ncbi:Uncharacterized protein (Fragment), partial [Durusdinium trenchii]